MNEHSLDISNSGMWVRGTCSCGSFSRIMSTSSKKHNSSRLAAKIRRQHRGHVENMTAPLQVRVARVRARRMKRGKGRS